MRRERGAADCRDCAILVTEVKRRGELVSIIHCCCCLFVCTLLLYVCWHIFQYLLVFLFVCVPFLSRGEEKCLALVFFVLSIQICSAICFTFCLPLGEGHGSQDSEVRGKTDEDKWKVETTVDNVNVDDFVNPNRPKKGLNTVKRIPSPPCIRIFQKNDRNDRDTENAAQYTFLHVMDSEICSEHLNFICICLVRAFRIDIFCSHFSQALISED